MRGVKDEEEIFTRVQGEIFKRIPPEKLNSFCEQVEDENVNTMNLLRGFLLPPATDYKEDILRMLLADGQVDLAAQDNDGNTALHLITQNAFFGYPFYRCIGRKYLQLLWDECIQRNFDFAITNHAGKSAQKLIDRVQRCIEIEDNTSFIPRYLALRRAVRQICSTAVYCGFTFVVSSLLSNLYDAVVGPVYARADQAAACWLGRAVYGLGKAVLTFGVMGATTPVYNALSEIIQRVMWRKNLIRCLEQ
jgi:hypothetical protein